MAHMAYSPVGYIYNADQYCLDCIPYVVAPGRDSKQNGYVVKGCNCAECRLDRMATERGIDRYDEYSFDSDDFPKAIPYFNDIHADCQLEESWEEHWSCGARCGQCGEVIDPVSRYMGDHVYADVCPGEDNYLDELAAREENDNDD